jgi:hypothetical protein
MSTRVAPTLQECERGSQLWLDPLEIAGKEGKVYIQITDPQKSDKKRSDGGLRNSSGMERAQLQSFLADGIGLGKISHRCRISSTMILPPIRVEHSIRLKAAPTPFVPK